MVKAMMPTLHAEPTYDQFSGRFTYLHTKTPYAVKHPRYRVSLDKQILASYYSAERRVTYHISNDWPLVFRSRSSKYKLPHPIGNCKSRPVQYAVTCSRSSGNMCVSTRNITRPNRMPQTILLMTAGLRAGVYADMMAMVAKVKSRRNQTRKLATSKEVEVVAKA